ncbi:MAG TPA: TIGR03435 family protein [Bryobacteraceae bacterium]|nr:TIGR03435 family protein [Bryobacteraceae bacterium]
MRLAGAALLLFLVSMSAAAQKTFDAASIRRVDDADLRTRSGMGEESPGMFFAENMPLDLLIQEAYSEDPGQSWVLQSMTGRRRASWQSLRIVNEPDWAKSDRFDITARYPAPVRSGKRTSADMLRDRNQMDLMLRALLEDRFRLKTHRETRNLPVYELVVSKQGLLKQGNCGDRCRTSEFGENGRDLTIEGDAMNVTELAGTISMVLDRPVIDKTGVSGTFDVDLRWTPEPGEAGDSDETTVENSSGSIFTVLQEKLGLKLRKATGPIDVLVVDHVDQLTAN